MIGVLAAATATVLVVPHLLPQLRLTPLSGVAMWLSVLVLRAALTLVLGAILVLLVPSTPAFELLTSWCVHAAVPFLAAHLGLDGHTLGDTAVIAPAALLLASALSAAVGVWRAARAARRWLTRDALGAGPRNSLIVAGPSVVVVAAGIRAPRVAVSTGALLRLDDAELAASLEHEWGHVTRRHPLLATTGRLLHSLSRPLPGGRLALESLRLHLERDADDFAVRRTGDPVALASAICKASVDAIAVTPALAQLGGSRVADRLRGLLASPRQRFDRTPTAIARVVAVAATALTLTLAASVPAFAGGGFAASGDVAAGTDIRCAD